MLREQVVISATASSGSIKGVVNFCGVIVPIVDMKVNYRPNVAGRVMGIAIESV